MKINDIVESEGIRGYTRDVLVNLICALSGNSESIINLLEILGKAPKDIPNIIFWHKFNLFLNEVENIEGNLKTGVTLSSILMSNKEEGIENGMRILGCIDKIDSEKKMKFIINTTKSLLLGMIDKETYFRILNAITNTLYEDLLYLSNIIMKETTLKGNMNVLALSQTGLMIQAGIDGNEGVETQDYVVTSLGKYVDRYGIALSDEDRFKWYKEQEEYKQSFTFNTGLREVTNDEIDKMFE